MTPLFIKKITIVPSIKQYKCPPRLPHVSGKSTGTWTREQLLEACPEARTVPQIVIDGVVIGGYDQLEEYFSCNDSK
jgi:glutaredoxin